MKFCHLVEAELVDFASKQSSHGETPMALAVPEGAEGVVAPSLAVDGVFVDIPEAVFVGCNSISG